MCANKVGMYFQWANYLVGMCCFVVVKNLCKKECNACLTIVTNTIFADSEIVMVDGTILGDSFEQDRPWDDSRTTISGI